MKIKDVLVLLSIVFLVFSGCKKESESDLIALEKRLFDAYLVDENITAEPTASGLYFLEETIGTGQSPQNGDWVLINYDLYLLNGEYLIYTSDKARAIEFNIYDNRLIYGHSKLKIGFNIPGFDEGLYKMKEGGKAKLLFMSDLGYGKQGAGIIGPYSSLLIEVELVKVISNPISYEKEMIQAYLNENGYSDIDSTETGLYYIEIEKGTGDSAKTGTYVTVNVDGFLLDGRKFLDEDIFRFRLGSYDYSITEGLSEGVGYMQEGGKAKIIVPYNLGYGEPGKSYYEGRAKVPIPPYNTLLYDVELLNAK